MLIIICIFAFKIRDIMTKNFNHLKHIFDNVIAQLICTVILAVLGATITFIVSIKL